MQRKVRHVILAAAATVALVGCQSEMRRALNDVIDEREAGAHDKVDRYREFQEQLTEELDTTWGAARDEGCPAAEPLPEYPDHGPWPESARSRLGAPPEQQEAYNQEEARRRAINAEVYEQRKATWTANVPAKQCECIQETIGNVEREIAEIDVDNRFDAEREKLDGYEEAQLPMYALEIEMAGSYSAEGAQHWIDSWTRRREQGGTHPGWNDAAGHVDKAFEIAGMFRFMPNREIGDEIFERCAEVERPSLW